MLKFFLLLIVMLPSYAYGQRELALNQPIVEGVSIAGIKLGDSESDVFRALGFPDKMESTFLREATPSHEGLKFLLYGLNRGNLITLYTRYGKVEAIHLFWIGQDPPAYRGKTTKGIGLGDSVEYVKRYYGECEMSREENKGERWFCWYKNSGISFGAGADNVIRLIGILPPGKELPDYLKPENQRF